MANITQKLVIGSVGRDHTVKLTVNAYLIGIQYTLMYSNKLCYGVYYNRSTPERYKIYDPNNIDSKATFRYINDKNCYIDLLNYTWFACISLVIDPIWYEEVT